MPPSTQLLLTIGQATNKGRKEINQDFHGAFMPDEPARTTKGIAIALADGISTSSVSHIASETSVSGFLADYFCTPETWSVKKSAMRVLMATNSWLHAQTRQSPYRYEQDRGYVCTFSAMIVKSTTAHIFHIGDARVYRVHENALEQLTNDHRLRISEDTSYLSRALGVNPQIEIDYQTLSLEQGDLFVLATDGVYEHVSANDIIDAVKHHPDDVNQAAQTILNRAYQNGSADNLTLQLVRVDQLPVKDADELYHPLTELPFAPLLDARMLFDGFKIQREIHASHRSHVYLALDTETETPVILKTPSVDQQQDKQHLERLLIEEWIAKRVNNAHVLKAYTPIRKRNYLYTVMEYVDGQTLTQWMIDHPKPDLESVRVIVEQIAKGLRAIHRLEMVHQDVRPDNIMIDNTGTVKIIDFGATRVAGIVENTSEQYSILGTAQYAAPEYFLGEIGSARADIFSLGVITYQMLTGQLPYGTQIAKTRTKAAQHKLHYATITKDDRQIPAWVDDAIKKAVHPNPYKRYHEAAEFIYDLRHPNKAFLNKTRPPLIDQNPVLFWQVVSLILGIIVLILLGIGHA